MRMYWLSPCARDAVESFGSILKRQFHQLWVWCSDKSLASSTCVCIYCVLCTELKRFFLVFLNSSEIRKTFIPGELSCCAVWPHKKYSFFGNATRKKKKKIRKRKEKKDIVTFQMLKMQMRQTEKKTVKFETVISIWKCWLRLLWRLLLLLVVLQLLEIDTKSVFFFFVQINSRKSAKRQIFFCLLFFAYRLFGDHLCVCVTVNWRKCTCLWREQF